MSNSVRQLVTRRHVLLIAVVCAVVTAGYVVFMLPESTRVLLIGQTVEHCPDSEFSCPGQTFGLLHPVLAITVILMIVFDEGE